MTSYTAEDEETVKNALIALAAGAVKVIVSVANTPPPTPRTTSRNGGFIQQDPLERGLASGAYRPRTYARHGGRC
jgi:hypothetical protein